LIELMSGSGVQPGAGHPIPGGCAAAAGIFRIRGVRGKKILPG